MLHRDGYLTAYILFLTAVLGAVMGSFLNCMAWRIVNKESVLKGRSHCTECNHPLGIFDLIPVFGYIFLGGKCRYCGKKISPRYVIVELLGSIVFLSLVWKYDVTWAALRYMVLALILLGLSLVDLDSYEIPDGFIIAGILWWIVTLPLSGRPVIDEIKSGGMAAFLISGFMLLLSILLDHFTGKESLGGGDIKLLFLLGLFQGLLQGVWNLILSCLTGLIMVAVWNKMKIPFGPALSLASYVTMLVGDRVIHWYLGLFI